MLMRPLSPRHFHFLAVPLLVAACSDPQAAKQTAFANGNKYFDQKKYAQAVIEYRNAIKVDPRFGDARYKLAEAAAAVGDARTAYNEYIRAADLLPQNTDVQLKAVTYLLAARQFEDAKTRVQKVVDRDSTNITALVLLGNATAGMKDLDGAVTDIEQAIKVDPTRSDSYTNLAAMKLAQGQKDQARAAFQKAVDLDPKSVNARVALANFQWSVGEGANAERSLKEALVLDPKHVLANRMLADYYVASGRVSDAEPYFKTLADTQGDLAKITLAEYYFGSRRFDDAKKVLNPLVGDGTKPSSAPAEILLGQIAYTENRKPEAHQIVDKVLKRTPNNATALMVKAGWLASEGKTKDAVQRATAAVAAAPESPQAHYVLGVLQLALRDSEGATKSFTEVLRLNPRAALAQMQLAQLTLARGDGAAAVQFAQQAVANAPGNPVAQLTLARGLIAQGELEQAQTQTAALLKAYPNAPAVHALNGSLRVARKDLSGARTEYERVLQLDPSSPEAITALTLLDLGEKKTAAAIARIETRLATQPDRPELLIIGARAYVANGNSAKAEQLLRHFIDVAPADERAYSLLGELYLREQKLDAAKAEFEGLVRQNPKNIQAHTALGMILEAQNKIPDAKKRYEEVLTIDGRSAVAANNLAYLYADSGENLDRALNLAQTAIEQIPESPAVRDTLGYVYYKKGLSDLAVRTFQECVTKDASNPVYHYHLGLAFFQAGDFTRARQSLEAALKLKPDYADAKVALNKVAG